LPSRSTSSCSADRRSTPAQAGHETGFAKYRNPADELFCEFLEFQRVASRSSNAEQVENRQPFLFLVLLFACFLLFFARFRIADPGSAGRSPRGRLSSLFTMTKSMAATGLGLSAGYDYVHFGKARNDRSRPGRAARRSAAFRGRRDVALDDR
jgi:hypothetical protein